ncbi:glycosyltransferase [Cohnella suwonensis]|uniref:Glycosyltransferase n=1 Tax=Cohnella suwonensis TaxID=696072 RepID=A0ABW0LVA0_9BACL
MAKMVLYKGQSQYGALRVHIDQLAEAFRLLGHTPVVIDLVENDALTQLENALTSGSNFVFSLNAIGIDFKVGERSLYDVVNIPFVTALVDHPHYHIERLNNKISKSAVTCLDHSHLRFLSNYYPSNHFKVKAFWMPGGSTVREKTDQDVDSFLRQRTIPLLFTGSYRGVPKRTWSGSGLRSVPNIMDDVCDLMLSHDYLAAEDALDEVLKHRGIVFSEDQRKIMHKYCLEQVGRYIEAYRRHLCLESLGKAGVPMEIYGNGWDGLSEKWPTFRFKGTGSVEETLDLQQQSKICLHTNNNFVEGGHERVFNAMTNGAAVVSETSLFYDNAFENGKEMIAFSWKDLNDLPERIMHYLDNPETLWEIANAGHQKAKLEHSWVRRAEQILDLFELANIDV